MKSKQFEIGEQRRGADVVASKKMSPVRKMLNLALLAISVPALFSGKAAAASGQFTNLTSLYRGIEESEYHIHMGLEVFDAQGRKLPAEMRVTGQNRIALVVDDSTAQYPVLVVPWSVAQLTWLLVNRDTMRRPDEFSFITVTQIVWALSIAQPIESTIHLRGLDNLDLVLLRAM